MSNLGSQAFASVDGDSIPLSNLLTYIKSDGAQIIVELATRRIVAKAAAELGIAASDQDLQAEADQTRKALGLHKASATDEWLKAKKISQDEFEQIVADKVLANKLRKKLADGKVERYYAENKTKYEFVRLAHIVVADKDVAQEIYSQLTSDGADFAALAAKHSLDDTASFKAGYLGVFRRSNLRPEVEALVFGNPVGSVVGPVKGEQGWQILKVQQVGHDPLDVVRDVIEQTIFDTWVKERLTTADIKLQA
jgi:putative peptide maturation system protein